MADKARPCPCTNPELPQFKWVSTSYSIAVLKALHTDEGILTGEECSECASKGRWDWYTLAAIVIATKSTDDVQRALDVVRQQRPTGDVNEDYYLKQFARLLQVLSTLYQEKMVTEQEVKEVEELKPLLNPWSRLVVIQCTKPPDVVKRSAELLAEVGRDEEGKQLKVLAALYQKKVIAEHDLQKWKGSASDMHLGLVSDLCTRPSEDVATTADVLDMVGWKNQAEMLKVLSVLYLKKVLDHHEVMKMVVEMRHEIHLWLMVESDEEEHVKDHRVKEALWQGFVNVQYRKPPEVVTTTAEVLDELGLKEEATQLRVMSELCQKGLISEHDLHDLSHRRRYMRGSSSRHWLDSLVNIQSSKSADVHARTFDTLKSFSLTEVVQERQTKHTDVTTKYGSLKTLHSSRLETSEMLPSSDTMMILEEWGRLSERLLSKESTTSDPLETVLPSSAMTSSSQQYPTKTLASPQTLSEHPLAKKSPLTSTPRELSVSPPKTKVSSLQTGEGSDPPEIEGASDIETDEAALKRLCWIPFGIKTVSIEAKGGFLRLEPSTEILHETKEDTIFVEVPPDAVSTSADVKMRYAIIPSGPFTLPEGYQFGSPVVYIYYDGQRVTKPLTLHLPHWYGGEDHARDGLSFAVASHSLNRGSVYDFQPLAGGKFPGSSHYGLVEIHGHCSLYAQVFDLGATTKYLATFLVKEERGKTECNIAVTYSSPLWAEILQQRYRRGWKVSKHDMFQFKQDRITATLKDSCHVHGDWRADFIGTSEILPSDVQYDCHSIASHELLETAVKNSSYPPAIKCIVKYRKELKRTGTPTVVELHISGVDRKMEFQCPAYERIQADPPPPTLGSAQTDITSQPSLSVWEAALLPPTPVSTAQSTYSGAAHTLSLCPPQSVASSSVSPTPLSPAQCSPTGTAGSLSVCSPTTRVASLSPARFPPTQAENTLSVCSPHSEASSSVSPSHLSLTHSTQAETSSDLSVCPPYNRPTPVAPPPHTPGSSPTMNLWNKEALKSMREELGGVCMKDPGMIKRLEKSVICSPANPTLGFLSETQLQVVESKMTPTEKMNMVIDFLVEMEDKYFEYFCKILDRSNFKVKAKMLRDKAEELKISFEAQAAAKISDIPPPPGDDSNGSSTGSPSYIS